MQTLPFGYRAIVFGCTGGLGNAFVRLLQADARCKEVIGLSRASLPEIDFDEINSLSEAAKEISKGGDVHLIIDATGTLHETG